MFSVVFCTESSSVLLLIVWLVLGTTAAAAVSKHGLFIGHNDHSKVREVHVPQHRQTLRLGEQLFNRALHTITLQITA